MGKNTKNILMMMHDFSKQFEYKIDSGMIIEITMFLEECEDIGSFKLDYTVESATYTVDILVKNFSYIKGRKILKKFVNSIEYSSMTLYSSQQDKEKIHYTLYTIMDNGTGAHCEIMIKAF
ncbi:hypothetical protein [Dictyobacter arantiisoli]|uniref:Uncharacterized protein n=1 Tax=Dictyobacter arantiisoli TaxID=2014874 RepID=A0A5A5TG27_9CHLR|nr:hypothetical protein [Dictyobacter arantiisoli]GCF10175.1 hypothetical protein KDI_37390 [Dictyobacter arantiisoli]